MPAFDCQYGMFYERGHIMNKISQYLLSVIAAAMICGLVNSLMEKNKTMSSVSKFLTGLVLLVTVLRPLIHLNVTNIFAYSQSIHAEAQEMIVNAQSASAAQLSDLVKSKTEQYILEKASSLGANVTVCVELDANKHNIPVAVKISGVVSPYTKAQLAQKIANDLGIPREAQIWTG